MSHNAYSNNTYFCRLYFPEMLEQHSHADEIGKQEISRQMMCLEFNLQTPSEFPLPDGQPLHAGGVIF